MPSRTRKLDASVPSAASGKSPVARFVLLIVVLIGGTSLLVLPQRGIVAAQTRRAPASVVGIAGSPPAPPSIVGATWIPATPYPMTIVRYAFAQVGNDLYVLGGVSNGTRQSAVTRYNATTDVWTPRAPIPVTSEA